MIGLQTTWNYFNTWTVESFQDSWWFPAWKTEDRIVQGNSYRLSSTVLLLPLVWMGSTQARAKWRSNKERVFLVPTLLLCLHSWCSLCGWNREITMKSVMSPFLWERSRAYCRTFWNISKWAQEIGLLIFLWQCFWNILPWQGGVLRGSGFALIVLIDTVSILEDVFKHG